MNPRAAINDLLPFQGSPFGQLGYFSKLPYLLSSSDIYLCRSQRQVILYLVCFVLSSTFLTFLKLFFKLASFPRQLLDNTIEALHCQHFFTYFFTFSQVFLRKNRYCGIYIRKPQHLFSPYIFLIRKPVKIFDGTLL